MPLKDRYTLIERSNTLIEQSDLFSYRKKNEHNRRIKKEWENFLGNSGRNNRLKPRYYQENCKSIGLCTHDLWLAMLVCKQCC